MWKNESQIECRKIIEEIAPTGTQNESKTDKKWGGKPCKSRKIAKKRCFWKGGFLKIFWVAKKSKKGGITIIDGWVLLAPGLQWGTIGGTINQYNSLSKLPAASRRSGPGGRGRAHEEYMLSKRYSNIGFWVRKYFKSIFWGNILSGRGSAHGSQNKQSSKAKNNLKNN